MADTLGAVLAGINNGVGNGLNIYKTLQGEARDKRQEKLQLDRYAVDDQRYSDTLSRTLEREEVTDARYEAEQKEGARRWDTQQAQAQQKAQADAAYKGEMLRLSGIRTAASVSKANSTQRKQYDAEVKNIVDGGAKLVTPEGDVTAAVDYFNNRPGGLTALADMLGYDGDPEKLQGATLVNTGGMVMLAKRAEDGSYKPFDVNGDGKVDNVDTVGMDTASFANRLGVNAPVLEREATRSLSQLHNEKQAQVVPAQTLGDGAPLSHQLRNQGQQRREGEQRQQVSAGVKSLASGVDKFEGSDKLAAANNLTNQVRSGETPEWYDVAFANKPKGEREAEGVKVTDALVKEVAGSIQGRVYRRSESGKQVAEVSGDELQAEIKAALLARPDMIAEMHQDKSGRTKGVVIQAMADATKQGQPGAVQVVLDTYAQKLDGSKVLAIAKQIPQKEGTSNAQHLAYTQKVMQTMRDNQIDNVDEAIGRMR